MSSHALHIIHTEASCGWGGQELRILSECEGMMARGHRITLVCAPQSRILPEAQKRGMRAVALPIGRKNLRGLFALRGWLKGEEADVINTHSSTDAWLVALALKSLGRTTPTLRTRHISAPIPHNRATRWLYTRATTHIVTTGEKLRDTLIRDNRYPAQRITSVPTGIDTTRFCPGDVRAARAALGLPEEALIIGIVATLRSWKGHRYLLEAFAQLAQPTATLLVVGDGPQREALEAQAAELKIADRVHFAGNQADVVPWLQAMDIFVLPSYANEGVPQALLQALLCGLPAITTDVGSITEAAIDQRTALLVPAQNAATLAAKLKTLIEQPLLRQTLGHAARAHVAEHFSREGMICRMETLFHAAAKGGRG
ncbi:MAG: hypothetical protein RIR70_443 [Pseudomonadota bacterium]|jgi:glycosyltransferase involved in cell wall biosynthesis